MSAYDTLGVKPDADAATIKRQYRRRAKQTHPDTQNGNKAKFQDVQRAYALLSDPDKRKEYDEFGDKAGNANTLREQAEQNLSLLVTSVVNDQMFQVGRTDVVAQLRKHVTSKQSEFKQSIRMCESDAKKFRAAAKRLRRKTGEDSPLVNALEQHAENCDGGAKAAAFEVAKGDEMLNVLDEHEYRCDKEPERLQFKNYNSFTNIFQ